MNELIVYVTIGILTFIIGTLFGYLVMTSYYTKRFLIVARSCRDQDSVEPLIDELERET